MWDRLPKNLPKITLPFTFERNMKGCRRPSPLLFASTISHAGSATETDCHPIKTPSKPIKTPSTPYQNPITAMARTPVDARAGAIKTDQNMMKT
jgi:hypothetical protein